jgi:hypothetical protein
VAHRSGIGWELLGRPITWDESGGRLGSWLGAHRIGVILSLGIFFRLAQYLSGRRAWIDEVSLAANIRDLTPAGLFGPLLNNQLAPPGFLLLEWAACHTLGNSTASLRFFPLVFGIAALFLLLGVARRCLRPGAVPIALGLFAVSDELIYYASELKQYSGDVAGALAATLLALTVGSRPVTVARLAALGAFGAAVVWFSHPMLFVLAGVGVVLLGGALVRRDARASAGLIVVGLAWLGSFAASYAVARVQLSAPHAMWTFWNFAFPAWPPRSAWDASWALRRFLYLFVNPLNFDTPAGPRLSALPAAGLFLVGAWSLRRTDRKALGLLVLPGLFALLAAALRLYPFHGRLTLFLAPALILVIAEGAARVRDEIAAGDGAGRLRRAAGAAVLAAILLFPTLQAVYHVAAPRFRSNLDPHGDRRPHRLDPEHFPF